MLRKLLYKTAVIFIIYLQVSSFAGCTKEYSYEGGPVADTISLPQPDTILKPAFSLPSCEGCSNMNAPASLFWSFKFDTSLLCGTITNSVITPERNGFTFFGPSTCSIDTGLVMTVFLVNDSLNRNKLKVTSDNASLEYYDNTTQTDVFIASHHLISFTIDSYVHATGIAIGTFTGHVKTRNGTLIPITNGKFTIQFK